MAFAFWIVSVALGQNPWTLNQHDLKRADPRKTALSYVIPLILLAVLFVLIVVLDIRSTSFLLFAGAGLGVCFMLIARYLEPWIYVEPRAAHFPQPIHLSPESR